MGTQPQVQMVTLEAFINFFGTLLVKMSFNLLSIFFTNNYLMSNLNSSLTVLIPKVQGEDKLDKFRLIALANFQFKIITKILVDRLGDD